MKLESMKKEISDGRFDEKFKVLYGDASAAEARYSEACDEFAKLFGADRSVGLYSAPGRTEVGGNHTDHQLGCVIAGSVNLDVIAVASENNDNTIRIKSAGFNMDTVDLSVMTPVPEEQGHAAALIRGVCAGMLKYGCKIGGFDAYTTSNVLKGSGLSSSATAAPAAFTAAASAAPFRLLCPTTCSTSTKSRLKLCSVRAAAMFSISVPSAEQ